MKAPSLFSNVAVLLLFTTPSAQTNIEGVPVSEDRELRAVIDMSAWLDKPAGVHGFMHADGNRFLFDDGVPVTFWRTNIAGDKPFLTSLTVSSIE